MWQCEGIIPPPPKESCGIIAGDLALRPLEVDIGNSVSTCLHSLLILKIYEKRRST